MPGQRHGAVARQPQPSAPIVAQQLSTVLLSFPAAAAGGVQWQVLVRKYEERHSTRLDLAALGHSSPLAAATALLWDVLRMVDREDTDNPVVAVEDAVALAPQPGQLGSWPSLYAALCDLVLCNGAPRAAGETSGSAQDCSDTRCLLLSQLRPLLERHWHASFDESSLGFLNEEGTFLKLKKMKHLLHAVLRWREQRQEWQRAHQVKPSAVDKALVPRLEVVASSKHNDLLLICFPGGGGRQGAGPPCGRQEAGESQRHAARVGAVEGRERAAQVAQRDAGAAGRAAGAWHPGDGHGRDAPRASDAAPGRHLRRPLRAPAGGAVLAAGDLRARAQGVAGLRRDRRRQREQLRDERDRELHHGVPDPALRLHLGVHLGGRHAGARARARGAVGAAGLHVLACVVPGDAARFAGPVVCHPARHRQDGLRPLRAHRRLGRAIDDLLRMAGGRAGVFFST